MAYVPLDLHLSLVWIWILFGFVSGALLGLGFHREHWLGGYASLRRRMYRLGHISFFGLALMNLVFVVTVREARIDGPLVAWASRGLLVGAVAMPVCCLLMAHRPAVRLLFAVPVSSLVLAAVCTVWALGAR